MNEIALMLLMSGWRCPPVPFAEVFYNGEYVILCVDGEPYPPVTGPFDRCERVDVEIPSA